MRAYIDHGIFSARWAGVRIYVTQEAGPGLLHLYQSKGGDQWDTEELWHNKPVDHPPTITMPLEMLEAIVAAAQDILPPSAATDRHLKDALAVRDKALGMVERIIDADLAREAVRK